MKPIRVVVAAALFVGSLGWIGGCGGDEDPGGATSSPSGSSPVVEDGNDTIETADPITFDEDEKEGELSPTGDIDFYSFEGMIGQVVRININAERLDEVRFDPDYIDTIITLYNAAGEPIAENDDRVPEYDADSQIITRLPGGGKFFLRVADCWTVAKTPAKRCGGTSERTKTRYTLNMFLANPTYSSVTIEMEKGDDAASAQPVGYQETGSGGYYLSDIIGTFADATDVDVYSFKLPVDTPIASGTRPTGYFWVLPGGEEGNGSTTDVASAYIVDPDNPTVKLAEIEPRVNKTVELSPPLELGKTYHLYVTHMNSHSASNDFYVVRHIGGSSNPLEKQDAMNNARETAETLSVGADGPSHRYIEGDLSADGLDVDYFKASVPSDFDEADPRLSVTCSARQDGSGLRSLALSLFTSDGDPIIADPLSATETNERKAFVDGVLIPPGAGGVVLKVATDAAQDPDVAGVYYRCGLHFHL
jgi:hypothetical protein